MAAAVDEAGAGIGTKAGAGAGAAAARGKAKTGGNKTSGKRFGVSCNKTAAGAGYQNTRAAENTRKLQMGEDDAWDLPLLRHLA